MSEEQRLVRTFIAKGEEYVACLAEWERPARNATYKEKRTAAAKREVMLRAIREVAERYNAEVRAFKERLEE